MVAHEVGTTRRSNQRAVVKQRHDQFTGSQDFGGSINGANPAGAVDGFGFGDFDCGVESGFGELHKLCPSCAINFVSRYELYTRTLLESTENTYDATNFLLIYW